MTQVRNLLPPPLFLIVAATTVALWQAPWSQPQLSTYAIEPETSQVPDEADQAQTAAIFSLSATEDLSERIAQAKDRPLFSETRRAPVKADENDPAPQPTAKEIEPVQMEPDARPEPPEVIFKGFLRSNGKTAGLVLMPDSGIETWISAGDAVGDWHVAELSSTAIVLQLGEIQHVVELSR